MKRTKKALSNVDMKALETAELSAATGAGDIIINGIPWDENWTKVGGLLGGGLTHVKEGLINGIPGPILTGGFGH